MAAAAAGAESSSKVVEIYHNRPAKRRHTEIEKKVALSSQNTFDHWISQFLRLTFLASGSFGRIYAIDAHRVVKICDFDQGNSSEGLIRAVEKVALDEINNIQKLNALGVPHIVKHIDHFVGSQRRSALVMGRDDHVLKRFVGGFKALRPIMIKHMEALAKMHELGYAHFDLGPANLTLDRVIDFGATCKIKEGMVVWKVLTTLYYRAPEMFLGFGSTFSADVWSYGCCLFGFFTGRRLFDLKAKEENDVALLDYLHLLNRHFGVTLTMIVHDVLKKKFLQIDPKTGDEVLKSASQYLENEQKDFITRIRECEIANNESSDELELFIDLLKRMLHLNPEKRATFKELLNHPFLRAHKDEEVNFHLDLSHLEIDRGKIHFIFNRKSIEFAEVHDSPLCVHLPKDSFPLDVHIYDETGKLVLSGMILDLKEGLKVNLKSYESPEVLEALAESSSGLSSGDEERETA